MRNEILSFSNEIQAKAEPRGAEVRRLTGRQRIQRKLYCCFFPWGKRRKWYCGRKCIWRWLWALSNESRDFGSLGPWFRWKSGVRFIQHLLYVHFLRLFGPLREFNTWHRPRGAGIRELTCREWIQSNYSSSRNFLSTGALRTSQSGHFTWEY